MSIDVEMVGLKDQHIEEDICAANTLPASFYRDAQLHESIKERIFARSWQLLTDTDTVAVAGQIVPFSFLPGCLDEPLLLTRDNNDTMHCLSNVCTHRGNLLVEGACHNQQIRCRYHGRRFALDGTFLSTPGFEGAKDFPSEQDNLTAAQVQIWEKFAFASIDPMFAFDDLIGEMRDRLAWLPIKNYVFAPQLSKEYSVQANWALYVDNYLEGFHIPYVHPGLAAALDTKNYSTELYQLSNLQIGAAANSSEAFLMPEEASDAGKNVAAYYFWCFPNMMFNFYPWGVSINVVIPQSVDRTKILYLTYIGDESRLDRGAGANLDRTEREDENIIEQVQKGIQSRLYKRGRYSPQWEAGVHHFHRLLLKMMEVSC